MTHLSAVTMGDTICPGKKVEQKVMWQLVISHFIVIFKDTVRYSAVVTELWLLL